MILALKLAAPGSTLHNIDEKSGELGSPAAHVMVAAPTEVAHAVRGSLLGARAGAAFAIGPGGAVVEVAGRWR